MIDLKYEPSAIQPGERIVSLQWDGACDGRVETTARVVFLRGKTDCCAYIGLTSTGGDPASIAGGIVGTCETAYREEEGECEVNTFAFWRLVTDRGDLCLAWHGNHNGWYCAYIDEEAKYPEWETEPEWRPLPEVSQ